jgi:putative aldouronate transport system permease protein
MEITAPRGNPLKKKQSAGSRAFIITLYAFYTVFTLLCVYPFYYLIINSISANDMSANGLIMFIPHKVHFDNFIQITLLPGLGQAAFISLARTGLGALLAVLASAFLGFMFTQEKMWLRKVWYRLLITTMYFNAGLIPWYLIMVSMHLNNNFLAYILPAIVSPFCIILVKTYVESTPKSLQEAAEIDGAGTLRIFWQVVLPLCTPILATVAIFTAVWQWNSFQDTVVLMTDQDLFPLQFVLYQYIHQADALAQAIMQNPNMALTTIQNTATKQTPDSVRMTVSVVVVLPILAVYPFFQRYFVKGIMIGSVKG